MPCDKVVPQRGWLCVQLRVLAFVSRERHQLISHVFWDCQASQNSHMEEFQPPPPTHTHTLVPLPLEELLAVDGSRGGEGHSPLVTWPLVGCSHPTDVLIPHLCAYGQYSLDSVVTVITIQTRTWSWEGDGEEVEGGWWWMISTYCAYVQNFQKVKRYYLKIGGTSVCLQLDSLV